MTTRRNLFTNYNNVSFTSTTRYYTVVSTEALISIGRTDDAIVVIIIIIIVDVVVFFIVTTYCRNTLSNRSNPDNSATRRLFPATTVVYPVSL